MAPYSYGKHVRATMQEPTFLRWHELSFLVPADPHLTAEEQKEATE
jgi:hypothetical protein